MRSFVLMALSLAACDARLGGPPSGDNPGDATATDSGVLDPDTQPVCEKRQLFLSFEGETLTDGPTSDAKQNIASWMTNGVTSATSPPYRANAADRATQIQTIVDAATARLQPFGISVVTTRPVTGDYMMIVFGGTAQAMGSRFGFVQELDCDDQVRNDVAWVADNFAPASIPNAIVGSIGFGIGLTATLDPSDCMCAWDNACVPNTNNCVLHDGIARDPAANQTCAGAAAIQDEIALVNSAFCN